MTPSSAEPTRPAPAAAVVPAADGPPARRWRALFAIGLLVLSVAALGVALGTQQRLHSIERELAKRQQDVQGDAAEARMLAKQAQDLARDAAAKAALLDARVSEATLQRSQLEDLMQSLSRSRDENMVADVEQSLRVAMQQVAITGSAEPLATALRQADERLGRYNQPRLERVRRAIARDLDRVRAVAGVDVPSLTLRLDEAVRLVDELPLLADPRRSPSAAAAQAAAAASAASAAGPASAPATGPQEWGRLLDQAWRRFTTHVWEETRSLVRVTRIDTPEAALIAPEQAFFLRENLKLRLLNARLALLSRQFDVVQSDLRDAQHSVDRYFDRRARRVQTVSELIHQVASQARLVSVPRPDDTLAALAAAGSGH